MHRIIKGAQNDFSWKIGVGFWGRAPSGPCQIKSYNYGKSHFCVVAVPDNIKVIKFNHTWKPIFLMHNTLTYYGLTQK